MATNSSEHENKYISNQNQRKLCELRVFELKSELQKRKEDTTGNKPLLVSRLSNVCLFINYLIKTKIRVNTIIKVNTIIHY
jgi:hypothetical protein